MNKTTTARVYTAPNTWDFSVTENLAREQGFELSERYGLNLRRRRLGEDPLSVSFFAADVSISLFFSLRGGTKPARQEAA